MSTFYVKSYNEDTNDFSCLHVGGGADCRVDPLVSCALKADDDNFREIANACVGKTYKTEDKPLFSGGSYLPSEWIES